MKKTVLYQLILVLSVIFLVSIFSLTKNYDIDSYNYEQNERNKGENSREFNNFQLKISASNEVITINNNSDLAEVASSGYGNETHPYIIEDLSIDANGNSYGILINNTDKHFVLTGSSLYNATGYGVYLNNVSNAHLKVNVIYDCLKAGVYMEKSFNSTFFGNIIFDNNNYGIFLEHSNLTEVIGNSARNNGFAGIYFNNSNHNNITSNSISDHDQAIFLYGSNFTIVANNTGFGNDYGIKEINCEGNIFEGNVFEQYQEDEEKKEEERNSDDSKDSKDLKVIVNYTNILLVCSVSAIVTFSVIRIISKKKLAIFGKIFKRK